MDSLLLNVLTDEEVTHCNVLGLLVIGRALSRAQRAFIVTKKASLVNMKTNRIKQVLDKTTSREASDNAMNPASGEEQATK